ncbi:MAG: sulfite exporter TauE/SafE family protein [Prochlorotrichaceae cyanobacterium]
MNFLFFADHSDLNILISLGCISVVSWFISTLSGGGSSLLIMPMVGLFLGTKAIPPVTTLGAIVGNSDRGIAYRRHIRWDVILWETPGALVGSFLGAFILSRLRVDYLGAIVGGFLVFSTLYFFYRKNQGVKTFEMKVYYFLPAGFFYATLSSVIGSMAPVLGPCYLSLGLEKEALLGTQAVARLVVNLAKLLAYSLFGLLTHQYILYGLFIGLCALPGNWLGNAVLEKMSEKQFRQVVMFFVFCSGLLMLWQNMQYIAI